MISIEIHGYINDIFKNDMWKVQKDYFHKFANIINSRMVVIEVKKTKVDDLSTLYLIL